MWQVNQPSKVKQNNFRGFSLKERKRCQRYIRLR